MWCRIEASSSSTIAKERQPGSGLGLKQTDAVARLAEVVCACAAEIVPSSVRAQTIR